MGTARRFLKIHVGGRSNDRLCQGCPIFQPGSPACAAIAYIAYAGVATGKVRVYANAPPEKSNGRLARIR